MLAFATSQNMRTVFATMRACALGFVALLGGAGLSGCGLITKDIAAYEGPAKPDSELAVVREDIDARVFSLTTNGRSFYPHQATRLRQAVRLEPGTYSVDYTFVASDVLLKYVDRSVSWRRSDTVELLAGHSYLVDGESCSDLNFCTSHTKGSIYVWIKDETTGQVVAGVPW
jgi:hypothetical protein